VISYRTDLDGITADQLAGFFEGWPAPPTADALLTVLRRSSHAILAVDDRGAVVGLINALTDGRLAAYIPLLEVRPSHRGRGVGTELVRRMLDALSEVYMTDLVCDNELVPFYERLGLVPLAGMARRNRHASVLATAGGSTG
jgi:ribosomal protein S18 acetylase RimI-like enzyme